MKIFLIGINFVTFSLFYLAQYVRQKHITELQEWLAMQGQVELKDMKDVLENYGIWSKKGLVSTYLLDFDNKLLKHEDFRETFRDIKTKLREEIMLSMWLKDKGLTDFLKLEHTDNPANLRDMGYWYPGEIFNFISAAEELESAERYNLRTNVHKFKAAVREFVSGQSSSILNKRTEYEDILSKPLTIMDLLDVEAVQQIFRKDFKQVAYMVAFAVAGHLITILGVPSKNPGTSNPFPAFVMFWIFPNLGRFCLYIILLYRIPVDPVKTIVCAASFHIWMFSTQSLQIQDKLFGYNIFIFLSMGPTIAIFLFYKALKFQPMVVRDSDSDNLDATFSGLGCIDPWFKRFIQSKHLNPFYRFILALSIEDKFDWVNITRLRTEDIDASWDVVKQTVIPAMENKKLNTLWIINNRLFDDKAAKELADQLKNNTVLENLRIVFDYNYRFWEYGYHFLLWDNIPVTLTSKGIKTIVKAIKVNKDMPIKLLDFYGVELADDCIEICKEIHEKRQIGVMGSKQGQVMRSVFDCFFQFRLIKLMSSVAVLGYVGYMVNRLVLKGM